MAKLFNLGTNKQGLIVYGGESSADYGMVVSEAPAFEAPTRKTTVYNVAGRNGAVIFQEDAWEDVMRAYKVWLAFDNDKEILEAAVFCSIRMAFSNKTETQVEGSSLKAAFK